ncbi:autotransporter domain-containing protein [Aliarcobacter butzleri]|uniref:autotransporter family protein n=1 Tax=Aliarcobacter butzleri TaxID=28197 RepID=UPI0021B3792D|nr:autotransporter outer membrane beta-barrel domain-containing protein [Aliarcobacter butzleri]MCT7566662.1 autotransporter domain-containing protein [Aliarcobacter butzleri]MCT7570209.1 autotransporter domain-containing protein [Aliarcobacter butzleri]MCT7631953.1 autotransporter domain-containing protein [Aliarcobacter butzleri]
MKIDYSKTSKVSFLLSTILLGAVSLSATNLDNQILEINNTNTYDYGLQIESSNKSKVINNGILNITNDWTAINAKEINNSSIINNGNINIIGNNNDVNINGIDVLNLQDSSVKNSGNITANLNSDATINGIVIRNAQNSSVNNSGLIDLKSVGDDLYLQGIHLDGWTNPNTTNNSTKNVISSEIINDKNIVISTKGRLSSALGISAYDIEIGDSQIINNGKISVNAEGTYTTAEGIALEEFNNSQIVNTGVIEANTDGTTRNDAIGIWIDDVYNTQIENSGIISVNANTENLKSTLAESIGVGNFQNSTLTNNGIIEATINNKLDKQGIAISNDKMDSNSTIINTKDGKIYGNVLMNVHNVTNNDGKFINEGFISLPYNAYKNTSFTIDGENINFQPNFGNLVNSGTIEIGAYKDSEGNIENTQILAKTATFEKGSKMQVDVVAGSKAFVKGDTLSEVVTATDKLKINDLTLNQTKLADNSATLDFEYKYNNNQLDLVVSNVKKLSDIVDDKDDNKENNTDNKNVVNKLSVAKTLDEFRNNQSLYPKMGAVLSKIDTLSTNNEVVKAINSIVPTTSFVNTSSQITSSVSNIISNRLGNIKSGLNSGDEIIVDSNRVWIKAFGSLGDQKDKDSISGFDLKTYGLGLGYDKEYKEDQIIGLATFYTNANVETNGVNHENDVDAYSIVAYGSNLLVDEKTTIYYQGSYTWQNNDSKRELFTGEQANADFTSKTVALDLKVGHKININDKFAVEPNIGTTYRHFTNPSYNESGAGALNIQSERFTSSEFIGNIGTDFEYKLTPDSKLTATIGAGYDFKDDDNIVTSSFAGASGVSFDTKGIDNGRWNYIAGVGYDVNLDSQNNLNLQYNYQGEGSKYSNNVISLNYMYKF